MYSQCPECQTRFRVTAAALRAAHGTVRCGRCGSAFDALQTLTDSLAQEPAANSLPTRRLHAEIPLGVTGAGADVDVDVADLADGSLPAAANDGAGTVITEFHFSADDIERVFIDARDWQRQFGSPADAEDEADPRRLPREANGLSDTGLRRAQGQTSDDVFVHEPEAVEDITLEGERIVIEGLPEFFEREGDEPYTSRDDAVRLEPPKSTPDEPVFDLEATDEFEILREGPQVAAPAPAPATPLAATPVAATAIDTTPVAPVAEPRPEPATTPVEQIVPFRLRDRSRALAEAELGALDEHDDGTADRSRSGVLWSVGAMLLLVVLLAQVVHQYRHDLVRDARFGDTLRAVYAQVGRPLAPDWDLAAFELQQWGASESDLAAGAMTVRASLRNGASFAQPLPLLRMEFEDRFGGTVARRDFAPREYLKDPAQASRMLAPGDRTEAELAVVDVGSDAVGYRLDVCLPDEAAGVRCAQVPAADGQPR
jgi:predicted Zn finger-like uncharacterized protein